LGNDAILDNASANDCNLDQNTGALYILDCTGYTRTLNQAGFTIQVDKTFWLNYGMTFTHGNGLLIVTGLAGMVNANIYSGGHTLGALQIDDGTSSGITQQDSALTVAGDVTFTSGLYFSNGYALNVGGTVFFACNESATLDSLTCDKLDCTGATGTLTQNAAWTISGDTFKLVAGMTFVANGNTIDFSKTSVNCLITSGGKTLHTIQLGTAGPGCNFNLTDNMNLSGDLVHQNGNFTANANGLTVAGTIYYASAGTSVLALTSAAALDCTGATGTMTLIDALTITGSTFKLVAGMTFFANNQLVDCTATSGTVAITSAGKSLYDLRTGNGGAGGTYQLQDNLTLTRDLSLKNGTWQSNTSTITADRKSVV
jgi:hypothetical protein